MYLTTSASLLTFKVKGQGHMGFCVFSCVHDTAATRGQNLAFSKAWWSCFVNKMSHFCKLTEIDNCHISMIQL